MAREKDRLVDEVNALRAALIEQWISNHYEHCGRQPVWQHDGMCHWPMPEALTDHLSVDAINALLKEEKE